MTRDAARRLRLAKKAAKAVIAAGGTHLEAVAAAQAFGTPVGERTIRTTTRECRTRRMRPRRRRPRNILDDLRLDHAGEQQQQQQQQESITAVEMWWSRRQQQQEQPLPELQAPRRPPEHRISSGLQRRRTTRSH